MKIQTILGLVGMTVLVTGCPHNEYIIDLTPRGSAIERSLEFYRMDGTETNGVPKYQGFPSNELAEIAALYPPGAVTQEGERHFAKGQFSGSLPGDVGGSGSYKSLTTSMGSAAYYVERFRGNDDLAAQQKKRIEAADRLADLVMGWARTEFRHEPGYKNLRRFLEKDFRNDLRNLGLYMWAGDISSSSKPQSDEEFAVRFAQYAMERGYVKAGDTPLLALLLTDDGFSAACRLIQSCLEEKLGVAATEPMPKSLAGLADPEALVNSWSNYVAGTEFYQERIKQWEKEKKSNPQAKKPAASDAANELFMALITSGASGDADHLTVRLTLPGATDNTNGKWDESRRQVVWESDLEAKESAARLPAFCYANWSFPAEDFQKQHFGRVILSGNDLMKYCVWRSQLDVGRADEWDKLMSGTTPGGDLTNTLTRFEFTAEAGRTPVSADYGKNLIKSALEHQ